jgi:hypothetical protein
VLTTDEFLNFFLFLLFFFSKELTVALLFSRYWRGYLPLQTLFRRIPPPKTPPLVQVVVFLAIQIKKY